MRRDVRDEVRATGTEEYWAVVGLGRIHRRRYAYRHADTYQQNVSEFCKNNKKSDTPRIRIGRVSDTYPYPKRIGHAIRLFPEVSVFHRWARLPPCPPLPAAGRGCTDGREGYLLFDDGHLLFDPAVSPHYQVLGLPYLVSVDQLKKKFAEGQLVAWPPSPWTVQVFSSGTQRWENRSIVREGEAIAIPDLVQLALQQPSSISHCYNAYWHGSLYIHFNEGFIVRYRLSYIKTLHTSRRRITHLLC
jgi:hypothetical protein